MSIDNKQKEKMEETIKYEPSIQQENKVIRKINRVAVPFMLLIMFFQQLDKMTLNYSAMLGIYNDVNLTHDEFGLAGSLYFLAQMIFQATIVIYSLQQYPISKVLGIAMFCWSLSIIGTAFVNNFTQLALCRFILGAFEAFTYPSLFLFIKTHYRRSEQGTYLALVYISLCVAIMCGSFFTYGIGQIGITEFMHGRGNWAWSMVIYGAVTLCFSIVVFFYLPDTPYSKRFNLSEQEKEIVSARIRDNNILHVSNIQWEQIFESIKETRYWSLVILTALSNLPNGAIATFSSQLIRDLGFSKLNSIILNVPRPMWEIVTYLIFIFTTTRIHWCKKHVAYTNAFFMLIPTLGVVLLRAIPVGEAFIIRLIGICITPTTFATLTGQALVSSNVAGKTKMIFYTTTVTMANTLGHFLGGLMIRQNEYPGYSSALSGYITADIVTILLLAFIGWSYQNDNQLRQKKQYASIVEGDDLTDVQLQHHFIYRP